jgi:SAM-dependent methyltransferase
MSEQKKTTMANRISKFNRERKWKFFTRQFAFNGHTSVLDVGFNNVEYSEIDNYLEKVYPHPEKITALGVTGSDLFQQKYPLVKAITYDGNYFPFEAGSFDIVWSNAVLEHVGRTEKQVLFLKEIRRVGKRAFITTPNRYFPIEIHTRTPLLHFLPQRMFYKYLKITGRKWATEDYMNLLSKKAIVKLLKEAGIHEYNIARNKLFLFTLDFVITF